MSNFNIVKSLVVIAAALPPPQHFADPLIPCCFAKAGAILGGELLSLKAATRYDLCAISIGGTTMNDTFAAWTPRALSVLRIITGLLIIQHGMGKILGFPAFPAYANVQPLSLIGAAGFIELIGGALLILGLFTQPVAFILAGEMAFAYFIGHFPKGYHPLINGGTLAILYCFTCLYLSTAGAGPWSIDASMKKA